MLTIDSGSLTVNSSTFDIKDSIDLKNRIFNLNIPFEKYLG